MFLFICPCIKFFYLSIYITTLVVAGILIKEYLLAWLVKDTPKHGRFLNVGAFFLLEAVANNQSKESLPIVQGSSPYICLQKLVVQNTYKNASLCGGYIRKPSYISKLLRIKLNSKARFLVKKWHY